MRITKKQIATKEPPMAIAPDGAVIQIVTEVGHSGLCSSVCAKCYMQQLYCRANAAGGTAKLLGVDCRDYDYKDTLTDRVFESHWEKVND